MEMELKSLRDKVDSLELYIVELEQKLQWSQEQIAQLLNRKFGRSTDKVEMPNQIPLKLEVFNEAEVIADEQPEPKAVVVTSHKRCGRRKLPADLPRETIVHDIPEEEKIFCECHQPMELIGRDRTENLKCIPAQVKVEVHERPKYGCKHCECAPKQAKPAPQAIPKSMATASLLAV